MRTHYNQYTGLKYTKQDILNKCKIFKNRKEFNKHAGLVKCSKKLGILNECNDILDENKKKYKEENIKKLISRIENEIVKYRSISSFLAANKKFRYVFYNNKIIKKKYENYFIKQKYSTQQLICKKIIEFILKETCLYNSRKILKSKMELDIFFEKYNLAVEYNGFYWHKNRKKHDLEKENQCNIQNITLLIIKEPKLNEYNTIEKSIIGIKKQFKSFFPKIKKITNSCISEKEIDFLEINQTDLVYNLFDKKDLEYIINYCCRYSEIKVKYNKIWQYLVRNKLLYILEPVKKRDYIYMKEENFIKWVLLNFKNYSKFIKHKSYQLARKRKFLNAIKQKFHINVLKN
jgi:hypothetical protein